MPAITNSTLLAAWRPSPAQAWDIRRAVHLLRRAGLGANWNEIQLALREGPQATIDRLVRPATDDRDGEFESLSQVICDAAVASNNIQRLQAWWLFRMLRTPDPLRERLTLMWHNHFATSYEKVQDVARMRDQNENFRRRATASYADLLVSTIKDPAMLVWLDADANRKEHPNENLAREIMELFTLGVDAFRASNPNAAALGTGTYDYYTEFDIQQAARALSGWTVSASGFRFNSKYHDEGPKNIFGKSGKWDGDQLLRLLIAHPATPQRLAWRLCDEFMGEECVTESLVRELAEQLRETGLDIGRAVETMLRSQAFFDDANIGSRVASPVELVVGSLRSLEMLDPPPSTLLLAEWTARIGQSLFHPPNVFGWPGARSWLTTRTIIGRANFSSELTAGQLHHPAQPLDAVQLAKRHGCTSREQQQRFFAELLIGSSHASAQPASDKSLDEYVSQLLASPIAQLR